MCWGGGVCCAKWNSVKVIKREKNETQSERKDLTCFAVFVAIFLPLKSKISMLLSYSDRCFLENRSSLNILAIGLSRVGHTQINACGDFHLCQVDASLSGKLSR